MLIITIMQLPYLGVRLSTDSSELFCVKHTMTQLNFLYSGIFCAVKITKFYKE